MVCRCIIIINYIITTDLKQAPTQCDDSLRDEEIISDKFTICPVPQTPLINESLQDILSSNQIKAENIEVESTQQPVLEAPISDKEEILIKTEPLIQIDQSIINQQAQLPVEDACEKFMAEDSVAMKG